ncbi:MAG: hypothetical protein N4A62_08345 [Marinisporobacter sp.]|nr:hypothetical protein [Marinisporobacter sp.]
MKKMTGVDARKRIFRKNEKRLKIILKYDEYSDILSVKDGHG